MHDPRCDRVKQPDEPGVQGRRGRLGRLDRPLLPIRRLLDTQPVNSSDLCDSVRPTISQRTRPSACNPDVIAVAVGLVRHGDERVVQPAGAVGGRSALKIDADGGHGSVEEGDSCYHWLQCLAPV